LCLILKGALILHSVHITEDRHQRAAGLIQPLSAAGIHRAPAHHARVHVLIQHHQIDWLACAHIEGSLKSHDFQRHLVPFEA
jgi:hypothetical protein